MDKKAQTIIDLPIALFFIVLAFVVFFYLTDYKTQQYEQLNKYLIITDNAITKVNYNGIGFAEYDSYSTKTTYSNTLKNPKLINPIKQIEIYTENIKVFDTGQINCEQIKIPRLVIYNDEISKTVFTFCK